MAQDFDPRLAAMLKSDDQLVDNLIDRLVSYHGQSKENAEDAMMDVVEKLSKRDLSEATWLDDKQSAKAFLFKCTLHRAKDNSQLKAVSSKHRVSGMVEPDQIADKSPQLLPSEKQSLEATHSPVDWAYHDHWCALLARLSGQDRRVLEAIRLHSHQQETLKVSKSRIARDLGITTHRVKQSLARIGLPLDRSGQGRAKAQSSKSQTQSFDNQWTRKISGKKSDFFQQNLSKTHSPTFM